MKTASPVSTPAATDGTDLARRYRAVREDTERICAPLEIEDYVVQTMTDASPTKWHLAHTTWFFETFVLSARSPGYEPFHPRFRYLFNSYYNAVGEMHERPSRGFISRPTVSEVYSYRRHVDRAILQLLGGVTSDAGDAVRRELVALITLGLHHEQQHQELMLTDLKSVFGANPLHPAYRDDLAARPGAPVAPLEWARIPGGLVRVGTDARNGEFVHDNETPSHQQFLQPFEIANRLVTCAEFLQFMEDGGYRSPLLWLSDGWTAAQAGAWQAPLYWEQEGGQWFQFTLGGREAVRPTDPVCHLSFYEAEAFARWSGARLPSEAEWELTARPAPIEGNLSGQDHLHPTPAGTGPEDSGGSGDHRAFEHPLAPGVRLHQLYGDVWEWTGSPYSAYPGYRPAEGAIGEYNAKFMCNQMVLRGGSCVTPPGHLRPTYRNFWPPATRFQFTGIRLARDAAA